VRRAKGVQDLHALLRAGIGGGPQSDGFIGVYLLVALRGLRDCLHLGLLVLFKLRVGLLVGHLLVLRFFPSRLISGTERRQRVADELGTERDAPRDNGAVRRVRQLTSIDFEEC
jgi:hypothetical protein